MLITPLNNLIITNINKFNDNEASQVLNLLDSNTLYHYTRDYIQTFMIGINLLPPESQAHYDQYERVELNFIRDLIGDIYDLLGNNITVNEELPYSYIITSPENEGNNITIMLTASCILISSMHGIM